MIKKDMINNGHEHVNFCIRWLQHWTEKTNNENNINEYSHLLEIIQTEWEKTTAVIYAFKECGILTKGQANEYKFAADCIYYSVYGLQPDEIIKTRW